MTSKNPGSIIHCIFSFINERSSPVRIELTVCFWFGLRSLLLKPPRTLPGVVVVLTTSFIDSIMNYCNVDKKKVDRKGDSEMATGIIPKVRDFDRIVTVRKYHQRG